MEQEAIPNIPGRDAPVDTKAKDAETLKAAREAFEKLKSAQSKEPDLTKPIRKQAAKAAEPEKDEVEDEEEESETPPEKPAELKGLRQRLALAGLPRKIIESMSEDEVSSVWEKQEERERAAQAAISRASELEKQLGLKAAGKSEPLAGVPTDELDLDELAEELDQFGEDERKSIAKALAKLNAPLRDELTRIREVIEKAQKHGEEQLAKAQRARLSEKLSMLKENDRAWNSIVAEVRELISSKPDKFPSVEAAFDDVFESRYGEVIAEKAAPPAKDEAKEKAKVAAGAMSQPAGQKRQKSYTSKDAALAAYNHLQKNPDDVDGAKRSYGSFLVQ